MTRRPNDVGGEAAGPVDTRDGAAAPWQIQLTAVVNCLGQFGNNLLRIDEFRRSREDMDPVLFDRLPYFEQWTQGLADLLIEKGYLTRAEIDARMALLKRKSRRNPG